MLFDFALGGAIQGVQGLKKPTGYREIKTFSAEETNQWFIDKDPDYNPPYKPGTDVREIVLQKDTTFVRVYDKSRSKMHGGWLMRAEDIEELTPSQIKDKFALPNLPKYVCDVDLKAGAHLRTGEVNPIDGWGHGGGMQFDLIAQRTGELKTKRL